MASFIGTNDRETLLGAADELRRAAESYLKSASRTEKRIDRKHYTNVANVLIEQAAYFEQCATNGPTPTRIGGRDVR